MYKHKKRTGYSFRVENDEAVITLLRPMSGEYLHNNTYLVIYEDAHGTVTINTMTKKEVSRIYKLEEKDLDEI